MNSISTLLQDLVRINSINPDLVAGAPGESELARYIAAWLEDRGIEMTLQEIVPGRSNVIARVRGTGGGQNLMLNAHMDTVGVSEMAAPFDARIANGHMFGRGTYDMKSSLAACLVALDRARSLALRGDVLLSAVVDEEYASTGTDAIVHDWWRWAADAVIVTEPTEMQVCIAHKGFAWLEVETVGRAAHGSRPNLGIDAIAKMGKVLVELERLDQTLRSTVQHDLLISGSLHASVISGGEALSIYPAHCRLQVERRTIPGETPDLVLAQIRTILDRLAAEDDQFEGKVKSLLGREPFEIAPNAPIVQMIRRSAAEVCGTTPALVGTTFWMDSAVFAGAGIPTVIFGPTGEGAHAAVESVVLETVEQCVDVYTGTMQEFCNLPQALTR